LVTRYNAYIRLTTSDLTSSVHGLSDATRTNITDLAPHDGEEKQLAYVV